MAALEALYLQDPFWIWLAISCLFVALNLATGVAVLMWPGINAALVAVAELVGVKLGVVNEAGIFTMLCLAVIGGGYILSPRAMVAAGVPGEDNRALRNAGPGGVGSQSQTARLIGRIGRTSSEFVNGVGRVWIDGAEWGAEIATGEDDLPEGAPVRVVKVIGGIRLQVHGLNAAA
jgi:membrane protein implicated in regulation of membrane protease activity